MAYKYQKKKNKQNSLLNLGQAIAISHQSSEFNKNNQKKRILNLLDAVKKAKHEKTHERINNLKSVVEEILDEIPYAISLFDESPIILYDKKCLLVNIVEFQNGFNFEIITEKISSFHTLDELLSNNCKQYLINAAITNKIFG